MPEEFAIGKERYGQICLRLKVKKRDSEIQTSTLINHVSLLLWILLRQKGLQGLLIMHLYH